MLKRLLRALWNGNSDSTDTEIYAIVGHEISSGELDAGAWTKAFSESKGSMDLARARYVSIRVAQLKAQYRHALQEQAMAHQRNANQVRRDMEAEAILEQRRSKLATLDNLRNNIRATTIRLRPLTYKVLALNAALSAIGFVIGFLTTSAAIYFDSKPDDLTIYFVFGALGGTVGSILFLLLATLSPAAQELSRERHLLSEQRQELGLLTRPLAVAFWLHLVGGNVATSFVTQFFPAEFSKSFVGPFVLLIIYRYWACLATWVSAEQYDGPKIWAWIAKAITLINAIVLSISIIYFVAVAIN